MGLVLPIVGYVSGLHEDGSDQITDYVVKKRNFLRKLGIALSEVGVLAVKYKLTVVNVDCAGVDYKEYIETNLDKRPSLRDINKECTIIITDLTDLCRRSQKRTVSEVEALKGLMIPYKSIFFAPGFVHEQRMSDYMPGGELTHMYARGLEIRKDLMSGDYYKMSRSDFEKFFDLIVKSTMDGNSLVQRKSEAMA